MPERALVRIPLTTIKSAVASQSFSLSFRLDPRNVVLPPESMYPVVHITYFLLCYVLTQVTY
jgi:hypothetical protein